MAPSAQKMSLDQVIEAVRSGLDIQETLEKHLVPLRETIKGLEEKALGLENEHTRFAEHVLATGKSPDAPKETEKGLVMARVVRALARAKGDTSKAIDVVNRWYGKGSRAAEAIEQSVTAREKIEELQATLKAPQLGSDLETGGVFIAPEFSSDLIDVLRPMSVVQSLQPMFAPLNSGTLTFPKKRTASSANYIGEASNVPKTGITTGQLRLTARKLGALVPISNDLLRFGSLNADTIVRDDLGREIALRADLAKIRGLGTQHSPRGLRYWAAVANILDAATTSDFGTDSTPTLAEINNLTEEMVFRLETADVPFVRPGWIFHPRIKKVLRGARDLDGRYVYREEIQQGRFLGYPFRTTTQIPTTLGAGSDETEIYLADFSELIDAEAEGLIIDASGEAAYEEGGTMHSAFQQDVTLVKAVMLHDFAARHDEAIAVATGVHWSVPPVG